MNTIIRKNGRLSGKATSSDTRVKRTRRMLKDALVELIDEIGFDAVTIEILTKRAKINRTTFYLHYTDKHDLLKQSINETIRQLIAIGTKELPDGITFQDLETVKRALFNTFQNIRSENARFYQVFLGKNLIPHFSLLMALVLEKSIRKGFKKNPGEQRPLVEPSILASFMAGAFLNIVVDWLRSDFKYSPEHLAEQVSQMYYLLPNAIGY